MPSKHSHKHQRASLRDARKSVPVAASKCSPTQNSDEKDQAADFDMSDPLEAKIYELVEEIERTGDLLLESELVSIARLRPKEFSPKILAYFEKLAFSKNTNVRSAATDIVLLTSRHHVSKIKLAVKACGYGMTEIVSDFITKNAKHLKPNQIRSIIEPLAYRAVTYTRSNFTPSSSDIRPLLAVARCHPKEVASIICELAESGNLNNIKTVAHLVRFTARENEEIANQVRQPLFRTYMRMFILPNHNLSQLETETLDVLENAILVLYERDPEVCESILDASENVADIFKSKMRISIYLEVLRDGENELVMVATQARLLAFKQLLQLAIDNVVDFEFHDSTDFFSRAKIWMNAVAKSEFDRMFLGAVRLSRSDEQVAQESEKKGLLENVPDTLGELVICDACRFNDSLRDGLIDWVMALARDDGIDGVLRILRMYENVEADNIEFRKAFLKKIFRLITKDIATINEVLRHLYTGMFHNDPYVRGYAVQALADIDCSNNIALPETLYESWLTLLNDPHSFVHKSAVFALRTSVFPEKFKVRLNMKLLVLLSIYSKKGDETKFMVDCLDKYASGLTDEETRDIWGEAIPYFIEGLTDDFAWRAIDRMPLRMQIAKRYMATATKVAVSEACDPSVRKRIFRQLFQASGSSLKECVEYLADFGRKIKPPEIFGLAKPISLMTIAGAFDQAASLCDEACKKLPPDKEFEALRLFTRSLQIITQFDAITPETIEDLERVRYLWNRNIDDTRRLEKFVSEQTLGEMEEGIDSSGESLAVGKPDPISRKHYEILHNEIGIWGANVLYRHTFQARLDGLTAIQKRDPEKTAIVAGQLKMCAFGYDNYTPARKLHSLSKVYQCMSKFYEWRNAKIESNPNSDEYLESAMFIAEDQLVGDLRQHSSVFMEVFHDISAVKSMKDVREIEVKVRKIQIPVSVFSPPVREASQRISTTTRPDYSDNFAVLAFKINGQFARDTNRVVTNHLNDIELEINLQRWPAKADKLIVEPISGFDKKYYEFPAFDFDKPQNLFCNEPLRRTQKMRVKVAQAVGTAPFDFGFRARFEPGQEGTLNLTGHTSLKLYSTLENVVKVAGNKEFRVTDQKEELKVGRDSRFGFVLQDANLEPVLRCLLNDFKIDMIDANTTIFILDKLSDFANYALSNNSLKGVLGEEEFQEKIVYHLKLMLGQEIEIYENTKAGRGYVDIMVNGIPIELKAEFHKSWSKARFSSPVKQTVEYALAHKKKVGILCTLDSSPKSQNSKPVDKLRWICSSAWEESGVVIVVVVIQGRMPIPSKL